MTDNNIKKYFELYNNAKKENDRINREKEFSKFSKGEYIEKLCNTKNYLQNEIPVEQDFISTANKHSIENTERQIELLAFITIIESLFESYQNNKEIELPNTFT